MCHASVTRVRLGLPYSSLIKVILVLFDQSVVQLDYTKHCKFPLDTPVSSSTNSGPMTGKPSLAL